MSINELKETLEAIGRTPGSFRRDTGMLLCALDRLQEIQRDIAQTIYDNENLENEK